MAGQLVPLGEGPVISLDRPVFFVGRDPGCDVRIDSRWVSQWHCCIVKLREKVIIHDLQSTNGIYQNGRRVQQAVLAPQEEAQIANLRYQFVLTGETVIDRNADPVHPIDAQPPGELGLGASAEEVNNECSR